MSTLLVIGGTGFFGKSVLDYFIRGGLKKWDINKVICAARDPDKLKKEAPELITSNVTLLKLDISNCDYLPKADYVIHAAATTDASRYIVAGEEEKQNILNGTINFCELAKKYLKKSKIVYCSSGAVYGLQEEDTYLSENDPLLDVSVLAQAKRPYALSKRDSEKVLQDCRNDINVSIARCFAFFGNYLPRDQHFAIGNFIGQAQKGKDIVVNAKIKVFRSYMSADDLVFSLMTLMENSTLGELEIYNVGSDEKVELHDLAEIIAKKFNVNMVGLILDNTKSDTYIPSVKKLKSILGDYEFESIYRQLSISCDKKLD